MYKGIKNSEYVFFPDRRILKVIWLFAVLAFFAFAVYQVVTLVREFLRYPTVTKMNENMVSLTQPLFPPQTTVCNLFPLSSFAPAIAAANGIPTAMDYGEALDAFASCPGCTQEEKTRRRKTANELGNADGYYQYIGREAAIQLGHNNGLFIVECKLYALNGFSTRKVDCTEDVTVSLISTSHYFNCYEFYIDISKAMQFYLGMELTLYIDNFQTMEIPSSFTVDRSLGVIVSVDAPGTIPFNKLDALQLEPGRMAHIEVNQEVRGRLPAPYGDCKEEAAFGEVYEAKLQKGYTMRSCSSMCVERLIYEECHCKDTTMMDLFPEVYPELAEEVPYCNDIKLAADKFYEYSDCAKNFHSNALEQCAQNCSFSCTETIYKTSLSNSGWPKDYDMKTFYYKFIYGRPYQHHFGDIGAWMMNPDSELVKTIFLRLAVFHGDYRINSFNTSAAISQTSFLSQLGGALNLWSGITIIVFMEIIDLAFQIIKSKMFPTPRVISHGITQVG